MKQLCYVTLYGAEELTEYFNLREIERKDIVSINSVVDKDGDPVFYIFYYGEN